MILKTDLCNLFNLNSKLAIKPSEAVYISSELKNFLDSLDPGHKQNKWIEKMKTDLKANMLKGKKRNRCPIITFNVMKSITCFDTDIQKDTGPAILFIPLKDWVSVPLF